QAEDGIRDWSVTGVQTCALPILVAAPTGAVSGMWVVDLDLDASMNIDGMATLFQLIAQHGEIPTTLMSITPRGGRHLMFAWDSRSEERRVGKEVRYRGSLDQDEK